MIWVPYQRLIPHRSPLSHAPVLGSLIRLVYLGAWLLPLWFLFPDLQRVQWAIDWGKVAAFLVGVELSALNHLLLDGLLIPLPSVVKGASLINTTAAVEADAKQSPIAVSL